MKVYTRQGDKGKTSLLGGKVVSKADLMIEAYGEIDELNCAIGFVLTQNVKLRTQNYNSKLNNELIKIQKDLFRIASRLVASDKRQETSYLKGRVKEFERLIDGMDRELPKLSKFILPGGGRVGSFLHLARAICRRTERSIVRLSQKEKIEESVLSYFNRLSDLLYVMARFVNYQEGKKEINFINNKNG